MMTTTQINMMKEQGLSAEEILAQLSGTTTETKNEKNEVAPPTVPRLLKKLKNQKNQKLQLLEKVNSILINEMYGSQILSRGLGGQCTRESRQRFRLL